ncbi:pesticin C-terminus-like muramidase [Nisaea sediminum]|uniref:pesticin C-terminus-like muramidase n=1 Tax=Nisaea sediminum TaxID=2775867 RepID=UPI0018663873|nr:pesticin C-terminus-like muramidase [Nisaea sediminum]
MSAAALAGAPGIDHAFIDEREGGLRTVGYVPHADGSDSGVTIGAGVDLGQRSVEELERWGCSAALISALRPYLGLKTADAQHALDERGLILVEADARTLSIAARRWVTETLARNYERHTGALFEDLPAAAQTVIASVAYQYGPNLYLPANKGGAPKFWAAACRQDWPGLEEELRDFGDKYKTRRIIEADYLRDNLKVG